MYSSKVMQAILDIVDTTVQSCIYRYIDELTALHYQDTKYGSYLPDYCQEYHDPVLNMAELCHSPVKTPMLGFLANSQRIEGTVLIKEPDTYFLSMWHNRWRELEVFIHTRIEKVLVKNKTDFTVKEYQQIIERLNKNPFKKPS